MVVIETSVNFTPSVAPVSCSSIVNVETFVWAPTEPLGSWGFGAPKTFTNEGFGSPGTINCNKALVLRLICLNCVVLVLLNKVLTISATCCNSSWRKEETIDNSYKSYISNLLCDVRISRDNILCTHKYIFV